MQGPHYPTYFVWLWETNILTIHEASYMSIHSLSTEISTNNCKLPSDQSDIWQRTAQVALTRVLYQRYMSGEISSTEWEQRHRELMHICSPLNIRPFFDKAWVENGVLANSISLLDFLLHVVLYAA